MLIDGYTVIAQVVNFIILVWLLKRFLYRPILDAIDAREARIARDISDAKTSLLDASSERETYQRERARLDQDRTGLMALAHEEAGVEKVRLLGEARLEAEAARKRWVEALRRDQLGLHQGLAERARDEVLAIARQALTDLAGADLEARIVTVFVERLRSLPDDSKGALSTALASHPGPVVVRSGFELSPAQRELVHGALQVRFGSLAAPRYEVAPELVCGIELVVGGQKVAWSVAEYLLMLERGVQQVLDGAAP